MLCLRRCCILSGAQPQNRRSSSMPSRRIGENQAQARALPWVLGTTRSRPHTVSSMTGCSQGAPAAMLLSVRGPLLSDRDWKHTAPEL